MTGTRSPAAPEPTCWRARQAGAQQLATGGCFSGAASARGWGLGVLPPWRHLEGSRGGRGRAGLRGAAAGTEAGGGAVLITVLLGRLIVLLAHQPPVLHEVELVPRGQLPVTDDAGEAVQVVDEVLRLPDHLGRGDALLAGRAFCAEAPVRAA